MRSFFRDRQEEIGRCPGCGGPLYAGEGESGVGLCPPCARRKQKREENAMTIQEMGRAYRDQAEVLRERIGLLRAVRREESGEERLRLDRRISMLETICRETGELAALLEHYYDRGYRHSGKYTL